MERFSFCYIHYTDNANCRVYHKSTQRFSGFSDLYLKNIIYEYDRFVDIAKSIADA